MHQQTGSAGMHHCLAQCCVQEAFCSLTDCRRVLSLVLLAAADHLRSRSLVNFCFALLLSARKPSFNSLSTQNLLVCRLCSSPFALRLHQQVSRSTRNNKSLQAAALGHRRCREESHLKFWATRPINNKIRITTKLKRFMKSGCINKCKQDSSTSL